MSTDAKTRAEAVREQAETNSPWIQTPAKECWIIGYMTGALEFAFEREEQLVRERDALTAERDAFRDLAECRKPNPTLLKP